MTPARTHPVNVTHLVVGLVFLGIVLSWALRQAGVVDTGDARWGLPVVLLVAGAAGLAATLSRSLGRRSGDPVEPPIDAVDE